MFHQILSEADWPGGRPAVVAPQGTVSWHDLVNLSISQELLQLAPAKRRVGLVFRATASGLGALAQLDALKCDTFLMDGRLTPEKAIQLGNELRLGVVLTEREESCNSPLLPL